MSYAIQTKKRRFERILDSLTDTTASSQPPSSATSQSSARINGSGTFKRRRLSPASGSSPIATPAASLTAHYLPSSRTAFLDRLETFRHVTKWHVPSTERVNASVWAKRGWICDADGSDTVVCGACKQRLHVDLQVDSLRAHATSDEQQQKDPAEDAAALSADIHNGLVKKYQDLVVEAHAQSCPWRKRGCDGSIQRIEGLLNTYKAIQGIRARYDGLVPVVQQVPTVEQLPGVSEAELRELRFSDDDDGDEEQGQLNQDLLQLAICGWERKTDDVIECRHCFRSLGLWLYRGEARIVDKLDPVDSHLEYCPWSLPDAQDTEITVYEASHSGKAETKHKYAGWELVYQAITKDNAKRRTRTAAGTDTQSTPRPATPAVGVRVDGAAVSDDNDEQQEKRRLDLIRRVKELKKPFTTVKSLLPGRKKNAPL